MNLIDFAGKYRGDVSWSDSSGKSGSLTEVMIFRAVGSGLRVDHEDGSSLRLDPVNGIPGYCTVRRDAGEIAGRAFLTDRSLALDYVADVRDGVREDITDVWHRDDSSITRTGLIRQPSRTIWFEADMLRMG